MTQFYSALWESLHCHDSVYWTQHGMLQQLGACHVWLLLMVCSCLYS